MKPHYSISLPVRIFLAFILIVGSVRETNATTADDALRTLGQLFDASDSVSFETYARDHECALNPALGLLLRKYINSHRTASPDKVTRAVALINRLVRLKAGISDGYKSLAFSVVNTWTTREDSLYKQAEALRRYGARADSPGCQDSLAKASALFRELGCDDAYAETEYTAGELLYTAERYAEALPRFQEARDIGSRIGNPDIACRASLGLSSSLGRIPDQFSGAIEESEHARQLIEDCGFQQYIVNCYTRLGVVYFYLGDYAAAETRFRAADSTASALSLPEERLYPLEHLGLSLQMSGQLRTADSVFEESACLAESLQRPADVAWMHVYQADVRIVLHDTIGTRSRLADARELFSLSNDAKGLASANYQLGRLDSEAGRGRESIENLQTACAHLIDRKDRIYALKELGLAYLRCGIADSSLHILELCTALLDSARAEVPRAALRRNYLRDKADIVFGLVESHLLRGDTVAALDAAESYRAMSFDEAIQEKQARATWPETYASQDIRLRGRLSNALRAIRTCAVSGLTPEQVNGQLNTIQDSLSDLFLRASISSPRPARTGVAGHSWFLESSGSGVLSLYYFVYGEEIIVWASDGNSITLWAPSHDNPQLRMNIKSVLSKLKTPPIAKQDTEDIQKNLDDLACLIPDVVRSRLTDFSCLRIYPDGILSYLPFEAIRFGGQYLGELLPIEYYPSLSISRHQLRNPRPRHALRSVAVFGGSHFDDAVACEDLAGVSASLSGLENLPGVEHEIDAIRHAFASNVSDFRDSADQESLLKGSGGDGKDVLHFGTHGIVSDENPRFSCLVLPLGSSSSEDEILLTDEILSLDLESPLVVLSACQTGLGTYVSGEGILGFSRAFIIAGARSVVVSLWPLNDASSAVLMESFYGALAEGKSATEALLSARRRMITQTPFKHPYYWAALIAHGNWK